MLLQCVDENSTHQQSTQVCASLVRQAPRNLPPVNDKELCTAYGAHHGLGVQEASDQGHSVEGRCLFLRLTEEVYYQGNLGCLKNGHRRGLFPRDGRQREETCEKNYNLRCTFNATKASIAAGPTGLPPFFARSIILGFSASQ